MIDSGAVVRAVLVLVMVGWSALAEARPLHILVYEDANRDGTPSAGEPGVPGVVVSLGRDVFVVTDAYGEADVDFAGGQSPIAWARVPDGYEPGPVWQQVHPLTVAVDLGLRPLAAPIPGKFTFAVAADTHLFIDQTYFGAAELATAAGEATAGAPAFFTILGDLTQGNKPEEFAMVDEGLSEIGVPFVPVPGNHDWWDGGASWFAHYGPDNYSFDIHRIHFVVWNLAMTDDQVRDFLGAELARVPPDMTIVALTHAPPDPSVIAALRDLHVSYLLTGHTHTNRRFDHDGVIELNTEPLVMGGLDFTPGGYRVITVEDGRLTSTHHTVVDAPYLQIVSPGPTVCSPIDGALLVSLELDASKTRVIARVDGGDPFPLRHAGGWVWNGRFPRLGEGSHVVEVEARSQAGVSTTRTATFTRCDAPASPDPGADWPQIGGAADHAGTAVCRVEPPLVERWAQLTGGHMLQAAPVIADGVVYASVSDLGNGREGGVIAMDLATGAIKWRQVLPVSVRGSPAIVDGSVVIARVDGTVVGLGVDDGAVRWTRDLGQGLPPQAATIFASATADSGDALIGNQGAAGAFSGVDGASRWMVDPVVDGKDSQSLAAIAVGGGAAVGVFNRALGGVIAWDRATGVERWRVSDGFTVAINATPIIANNVVYVVNGRDEVAAFDLLTGAKLWQVGLDAAGFDWGNATVAPPAFSGTTLLVPTLYKDVVAIDAATGVERWRFAGTPSPIHTTHYRGANEAGFEAGPVITGDVAWVVDTAGVLSALDLATGAVRWQTELHLPVLSSLAVSGSWLVVASFDGTIHAYTAETPDPLCAPPVVAAAGCCDARHGAPSAIVLALLVAGILFRTSPAAARSRSRSDRSRTI